MEAEVGDDIEVQDIEEVDFSDIAQDSTPNILAPETKGAVSPIAAPPSPRDEQLQTLSESQMNHIDKTTMHLDSLIESEKPPIADVVSQEGPTEKEEPAEGQASSSPQDFETEAAKEGTATGNQEIESPLPPQDTKPTKKGSQSQL